LFFLLLLLLMRWRIYTKLASLLFIDARLCLKGLLLLPHQHKKLDDKQAWFLLLIEF